MGGPMGMSRTGNAVGELRVHLTAPGMAALHRVGVAGLWMTLEALEKDAAALAQPIHAAVRPPSSGR